MSAGGAWSWAKAHFRIYAFLAAMLVFVAVSAKLEWNVVIWIPIYALLVGLLVHEHQIRVSRDVGADADQAGRVTFGFVVLGLGIAATAIGLSTVDWIFVIGIALATISGGLLYGELRNWIRDTQWRFVGPLLMFIALALFVRAILVSDPLSFFAWILLAAFVGELGTELTSELSHQFVAAPPEDSDEPDHLVVRATIVGASGVVLALIGFGLLAAAGADPPSALIVLAVLAVIVLMASIDSDSVLIVAVIAIMLAIAIQPGDASSPKTAATTEDSSYFLVLGDSYISGEGAQRFIKGTNTKLASDDGTHTNGCRRAPTALPYLLTTDDFHRDGIPNKVLFLACSGATTENIHTEPRKMDKPPRSVLGPAELKLFLDNDLHTTPPKFVIVSIGGNDGGFGELAQSCIGPGDCTEVAQQFLDDASRARRPQPVSGEPGEGGPEPLASIGDDLDVTYTRIRDAVGPNVPIIVAPYPQPFAPVAHCSGALFTRDERQFIDGFAHELDRVIKRMADKHGFLYLAPLERALVDSHLALCDGSGLDSGLNLVAANPQGGDVLDRLNPANWTHNSLHPNEDGHRAIAAVASEWFEQNKSLELEPAPRPKPGASSQEPTADDNTVSSLSDLLGGRSVVQCGDGPECRVTGQHWLFAQVRSLYSHTIAPLAIGTIGLWLMMMPMLWVARRRHWTLASAGEKAWDRTEWFRSPNWLTRLGGYAGLVAAVLVLTWRVGPLVGLPDGYGAAQSRSAAYLGMHTNDWVRWVEGTTRDLALYIPIYLVMFLISIVVTSRQRPARRWHRRWVDGPLSDGWAAIIALAAGVADFVETTLFRNTLVRLEAGDDPATLATQTDVTRYFSAAKWTLVGLFALALLLRVCTHNGEDTRPD